MKYIVGISYYKNENYDFLKGPSMDFFKKWFFKSPQMHGSIAKKLILRAK